MRGSLPPPVLTRQSEDLREPNPGLGDQGPCGLLCLVLSARVPQPHFFSKVYKITFLVASHTPQLCK